MSRANEQALVTIASIIGCLTTMIGKNCLSIVTKKEELKEVNYYATIVAKEWERFDDNSTSIKSMLAKNLEWAEWLGPKQDEISCVALITCAMRLCEDLSVKLRNRKKIEMISRLEKMLNPIYMYATSDGTRFEQMDEAHLLIDKLQDIVGWEYDNFVKEKN